MSSPTSHFDVNTETNMDKITSDYILRTYGTEAKNITLTSFDEKMIKSIHHLRTNYHDEIKKRKCTVMLKESINSSIFSSNSPNKKNKKNKKIENTSNDKSIKKINSNVDKICCATQMNNKPCAAKAKAGFDFCGRHLPKDKK